MTGKDIFNSIKIAILDEQRRAFQRGEFFDRNDITIVATRKSVAYLEMDMMDVNGRYEEWTHCMGCKLKTIDGDYVQIFLAKEVDVFEEGRSKEE